MVQKQPGADGEDPELMLLGAGWKVKPSEGEHTGSSKLYVGPTGKEFVSLREAWKEAGYIEKDEFLKSGHPWIGQRVTRIFKGKPLDGTISSWLPPSGDEVALWHVEHDDGDSEDLESSEAEEALEEFFLRPNSRVEASFQGKWYPGVLRKIVRSKLEPYGVKCDSDKNNSMLLWVPRRNVQLPTHETPEPNAFLKGQKLNRALLEHKLDEHKDRIKSAKRERPQKQKRSSETRKPAHAGRRRPGRPPNQPQQKAEGFTNLISWNEYQRLHKGREVTTEQWRQYVRSALEGKSPKSDFVVKSNLPTPKPVLKATPISEPTQEKPSDGKRVRKKKVNPDYLWGDDLRNPKRALVQKLEERNVETNISTGNTGADDDNDDKCGVCTKGGNLLCCDGPCLRAFHLKCLRLREKDLPDAEWFCKDCAVGRAPRKVMKKGRPRPPPIQLPLKGKRLGKQPEKSQITQSDKKEKQTGKQIENQQDKKVLKRAKSNNPGSAPVISKTMKRSLQPPRMEIPRPASSASVGSVGTPRSNRRNAGVPSRFKDSYLTLKTPQNASKKRATQSEPSKGSKRQKTADLESIEEKKAELEERIRALESFLSSSSKKQERANSSPMHVEGNNITNPITPRTPHSPATTMSAPTRLEQPEIDISGDSLEPWRRCNKCVTGRRSMTCAKQMCAVCCRATGPCLTHCRSFPGDVLKIFKGLYEGKQGEMIAKHGRSISLKIGEGTSSSVIYVDEAYLCMVKKGENHDELKSAAEKQAAMEKQKSNSASKHCLKCNKRFRSRNALVQHQRSCKVIAPGSEVFTPFGSGFVKAVRGNNIIQVDLKYCNAFLLCSKCRVVPRKVPAKKKKRKALTPAPLPDKSCIETPRLKRQTSAPLRFKKAQLQKPMLMCFELIMTLKRHKYGPTFAEPVPKSVEGYYDIIKEPMDLGTIENNIFEKKDYNVEKFTKDLNLIWSNARKFNPPTHPVHEMAAVLKALCDERMQKIHHQIKSLERAINKKQKTRHKKQLTPKPAKSGLDTEFKKLAQKMEQMRKKLHSMSGGARPKPRSKSKPKKRAVKKKKSTQPAIQAVTWSERQVLKQQIIQLAPEDLNGVAEIVRDAMPESADSTEVEVDLEVLADATIRKLQTYVAECVRNGSAKSRADSSSEEEDSSDDED
eukprot:CAMPEP_0184479620 /NCGR_PEP_ID=MMETSP0113_2-20130426/1274_1 /TAXON_ID=91329 /ORGANISM="Norrisiella sphaerica, Strain BC52" /LENGTH=1155 /DNA_ID=CAMNT_0026857741 /DNA_START=222 /DNA_END=3689 /DNA_ORIENTATION=-